MSERSFCLGAGDSLGELSVLQEKNQELSADLFTLQDELESVKVCRMGWVVMWSFLNTRKADLFFP